MDPTVVTPPPLEDNETGCYIPPTAVPKLLFTKRKRAEGDGGDGDETTEHDVKKQRTIPVTVTVPTKRMPAEGDGGGGDETTKHDVKRQRKVGPKKQRAMPRKKGQGKTPRNAKKNQDIGADISRFKGVMQTRIDELQRYQTEN
jgi:hypothetical protein